MRSVKPKAEEQQASSIAFSDREQLLKERTWLHSQLQEFGYVAPQGIGHLRRLKDVLEYPHTSCRAGAAALPGAAGHIGQLTVRFDPVGGRLGHIVNPIAFFGSETMIVLAGVVTMLASVQSIHGTVSELDIAQASSLDLFVIHIGVLNVILTLAFFSFICALRQADLK